MGEEETPTYCELMADEAQCSVSDRQPSTLLVIDRKWRRPLSMRVRTALSTIHHPQSAAHFISDPRHRHALKYQCRRAHGAIRKRIVADGGELLPKVQVVTREIHLRNRLCNRAIANSETDDA
jgi:hypothetical protein